MNKDVVIYNSLSRKKEPFKPVNPPYVGLYVCGPTVYSNVHIGNVRTFVVFDVVYRYLSFLGYKVRYVRNITDVGHLVDDADEGEDKIAKRARLENLEPMEVVQKYVNDFHKIMERMNNLSPSIEPTATGHLIEQIGMIQKILHNGFAYEVNGSVYFDVNKYQSANNSYGKLSGRVIEDLLANTRDLDGQDDKRSSLDFALWKKADKGHIMKWPSPWGIGFPGWHLECSAMSTKYLGDKFDIHGGGMDLKFPHHECEIAQSVACSEITPANYWMHGNMLTLNGEKMSKSKGNTFTPEDLFNGESKFFSKPYSPAVVRFFMLQSHYSSTLDLSDNALAAAEKGFERLLEAYHKISLLPETETTSFDIAAIEGDCYSAMSDDFNTPVLISVLFGAAKKINAVEAGNETINKNDQKRLEAIFGNFLVEVLGIKMEQASAPKSNDDLLNKLMDVVLIWRNGAKQEKNYKMADQIRDDLHQLNISLKDSGDGTSWSFEK